MVQRECRRGLTPVSLVQVKVSPASTGTRTGPSSEQNFCEPIWIKSYAQLAEYSTSKSPSEEMVPLWVTAIVHASSLR